MKAISQSWRNAVKTDSRSSTQPGIILFDLFGEKHKESMLVKCTFI